MTKILRKSVEKKYVQDESKSTRQNPMIERLKIWVYL